MKLLKLVPDDTHIYFIRHRVIAYILSAVLILASLGLFFSKGLNYGIDFEGGVMIEIATEAPVNLGDLRTGLNGLGFGDVSIQTFGAPTDILIRFRGADNAEADNRAIVAVKAELAQMIPGEISYRRVETVGAKVSGELIMDGVLAVVLAIAAVLVYIWVRFEWQFGIAAVLSLVHDISITIGMFSLTGLEFNLSIIAALLAIVGYSLNDTVVVFDRIRENLMKFRKMPLDELLDLSINDTLTRTIMTSGTTLLALTALVVFGGEVIRGFTAAMIWGIFIGTYSSIFVASPLLLLTNVRREPEEVVDRP